jgi:UDPglucose--hexose-1-phosphate uridylyltransferase
MVTLFSHPHRRYNSLTGEWILVSPQRTDRPWLGKIEEQPRGKIPSYDPVCYLCPGNERANGNKNPNYTHTFVFDNDFSALSLFTKQDEYNSQKMLIAKSEIGNCKVVCFSPRHDLTLAEMEVDDIIKVVDVWTDEYQTLGSKDEINYIQIFENKGELMGCSNPHPHGQIWAQQSIPLEPSKETKQMKRYSSEKGKCLLCDYLSSELNQNERIVAKNSDFIALVPFWAIWPFEIMILSIRHIINFNEFTISEKKSFAEIIKTITQAYDRLFNVSFPYSAGIHQSPTDGEKHDEWHLHMHFYPPLLRSANVKKFMVGYEMLAEPQRDIAPEMSAEHLRTIIMQIIELNRE